jgi:MIP family channel proteins
MRTLLRPLAAETLGTMLFVFLGAGSVVMNAATGGGLGPLGIGLAHGIGMAVIVSATMSISGGHMNPAVTFAIALAGKIDWRSATAYVVAQLVGAVLGAALVRHLLPLGAVNATLAGTPQLGASVTFMQGIWIEAVLTFFLASAVFGTAVSPGAPKIAGFGIGLAIFVDALVGGNLTGAMMNPARALGPALAMHDLHAQGVYWIGPLLGAAAAGALWRGQLSASAAQGAK